MVAGFFSILSSVSLRYSCLSSPSGRTAWQCSIGRLFASGQCQLCRNRLRTWWGIDPDIGGLLLIVRDGHELENLTTGAAGVELLQAVEATIVAKLINLRIVGRLGA